ncbi:colorectal mutant cancer protein isoform X1 [Drosophila willistoni]|uniref:colorectal mutant cancer protein isoform X1 n=1 Tax=Drosophila willistoni TaxID=7260 RepID=UPI000C26C6BD|nr:colorectal mutant cancer protein isoform X1 [Drosophila willistoni]
MMSNDVQLARVAKISRPRQGHGKQQQWAREIVPKNSGEDPDFVFGSISPRGTKHLVSSHDLELDSPEHTQRDTTESDNNISSCSTLDIVNKVEQLSVQHLENRVRELSQRLQQAERQVTESNTERDMCHKRLEVVSQAHECRITEMHCVIAELSKKLRNKHEHIIVEEQEPEACSELSYQEGSVYNSELNLTNPDADAECQTEPLDDLEVASSIDKLCPKSQKGQLEALQEEVLHLRAQIALLQAEIATKGDDTDIVEEHGNVAYFASDPEANESGHQQLNDLNKAGLSLTKKHLPAVTKMAERVKLRCASKTEPEEDEGNHTELSHEEDINLVEHLVCELKEQNSIVDSFMEVSRLQRQLEHLKVCNTMLALTLDESRQHAEHLYLLCGKYESNALALQLAVNCSDRAIEAYDVMLALLESRMALLHKSAAAEESRRAVESVARHLLARLESEKNVCENSLGPWQHINLGADESPKAARAWTTDDDNRLRYHVSKLKGQRSTLQQTIINLESPFSDLYDKKRLALEKDRELCPDHGEKKSPMDIETAVNMQELLELRDQNLQLQAKIEEGEREQQHANERVAILQEALRQLQATTNRVSYSEAEHAALTEQQLVEALTRETELKTRIQTLLTKVTSIQKASDEKHEELQHNVRELHKSNHNLGQMLDHSKRKYQLRLRKLEQKILDLRLEHDQPKKNVPETTL